MVHSDRLHAPGADRTYVVQIECCQWTRSGEGWIESLAPGRLGAAVQLVWAFGVNDAWDAEPVRAIRRAYPNAQIVGCTTSGEIYGTAVHDGTLSATAIAFEKTQVEVHSVREVVYDESWVSAEKLGKKFTKPGLKHVFLIADGLNLSWTDVVGGLASSLPPGVSVSGGFSADGNTAKHTFVWAGNAPSENTIAAVGFYGDSLRVGVSRTGLWGPFGPDRVVTRSERNVVYEFDGRPALALYKTYLGEYAAGLPQTGLMFPLDVQLYPHGTRVLRSLLSVNESDQSISFAGEIPEGSHARLVTGNIEDLIEGTLEAARTSVARMHGAPVQLSLVVSCFGRRSILKQRTDEEIEAVREGLGDAAVLTGFYSYGEVAPATCGGQPELHNETMTITNFAEV